MAPSSKKYFSSRSPKDQRLFCWIYLAMGKPIIFWFTGIEGENCPLAMTTFFAADIADLHLGYKVQNENTEITTLKKLLGV